MKSQFSGANKYFGHIFHNEVLFLVCFCKEMALERLSMEQLAMERDERKAKAALLPTSTAGQCLLRDVTMALVENREVCYSKYSRRIFEICHIISRYQGGV
jgi:hypothetical protein